MSENSQKRSQNTGGNISNAINTEENSQRICQKNSSKKSQETIGNKIKPHKRLRKQSKKQL